MVSLDRMNAAVAVRRPDIEMAAVMLSWCALLRKDKAYTVLNVFWILVGLVGMHRAAGF